MARYRDPKGSFAREVVVKAPLSHTRASHHLRGAGSSVSLPPHQVGRGGEDGLPVAVRGLEEAGEGADRGEDFRPEGAARDLLDLVDEGFVVIEIDAGPNRDSRVVYLRNGDGITVEFLQAP